MVKVNVRRKETRSIIATEVSINARDKSTNVELSHTTNHGNTRKSYDDAGHTTQMARQQASAAYRAAFLSTVPLGFYFPELPDHDRFVSFPGRQLFYSFGAREHKVFEQLVAVHDEGQIRSIDFAQFLRRRLNLRCEFGWRSSVAHTLKRRRWSKRQQTSVFDASYDSCEPQQQR